MSDTGDNNTLVAHLEALRGALLRIVAATALLLPATYWAAPYVTRWLTRWCFDKQGTLYYFSPMEAFWVQLKLALVMALVVAYPWNALQVWRFVLPALYPRERRAIGRWVLLSSLLFFAGGAFCVGGILPIVMRFSESFSSAELRPMIGLAGFLDLAGWLTIAFALMFQTPIAVYLLVRMELVAADTLARRRSYVVVAILVVSALITPPDVVSQLLLAVPTWLLFEAGLLLARVAERRTAA